MAIAKANNFNTKNLQQQAINLVPCELREYSEFTHIAKDPSSLLQEKGISWMRTRCKGLQCKAQSN